MVPEGVPQNGRAGEAKSEVVHQEFKRDAVRLVVSEGYSFKSACTAVGGCDATLRSWHARLAPPPEPCGYDPLHPANRSSELTPGSIGHQSQFRRTSVRIEANDWGAVHRALAACHPPPKDCIGNSDDFERSPAFYSTRDDVTHLDVLGATAAGGSLGESAEA